MTVGARKNTPINNQTLCENGDMNYCRLYILDQKEEFERLESEMEELKENADRARSLMTEGLSGLGLFLESL